MRTNTGLGWVRGLSLAVVALFIGGCSEDSSSSRATTGPQKACEDTANAFAAAAQRACGQSFQANYDAFVQSAANGSCANILQVRDEASLRSVCLPWLSTATCTELSDATAMPAECKGQLLHA